MQLSFSLRFAVCLSAALGSHCAQRSSVLAFYVYPGLFAPTNFRHRRCTGALDVQGKLCAESDISHCSHAARLWQPLSNSVKVPSLLEIPPSTIEKFITRYSFDFPCNPNRRKCSSLLCIALSTLPGLAIYPKCSLVQFSARSHCSTLSTFAISLLAGKNYRL